MVQKFWFRVSRNCENFARDEGERVRAQWWGMTEEVWGRRDEGAGVKEEVWEMRDEGGGVREVRWGRGYVVYWRRVGEEEERVRDEGWEVGRRCEGWGRWGEGGWLCGRRGKWTCRKPFFSLIPVNNLYVVMQNRREAGQDGCYRKVVIRTGRMQDRCNALK